VIFGACPGPESGSAAGVVTKWGTGTGVRIFNGSGLATESRPTGASLVHVSWKPPGDVTEALVRAAVANFRAGDMVEIWHEVDVKYNKAVKAGDTAGALAEANQRVEQKNAFYDIVKRIRPDLLVAHTIAVYPFNSQSLYTGTANPSQASWYGSRVKADVIGADFDGNADLKQYPTWVNAIANLQDFVRRFEPYKYWTVGEFVHPRLDGQNGEAVFDADGTKRAAWAKSWAQKFDAASPGPVAVMLFDTQANAVNNRTGQEFLRGTPEYNAWRPYTSRNA